ncbi:hypothetical protein JMJ77_0007656 [Colletotrichum scovillei]|uniref:Uncharacterized protein n=1 Tax=Colletotrichum scovillei TaxID=1209932 RepID=A0A9P7RDE2_9PEZI|nr:hypothetical protein JMJ77_0007656 [Colletotrichum scovillei]KAG7074635.1 hypothetical protein JMJ76_0011110 [Colletotrichum scovillei]KAG7081661.1 hypothetical protein JMJ78_0003779 [Colletotrichum scovillei]
MVRCLWQDRFGSVKQVREDTAIRKGAFFCHAGVTQSLLDLQKGAYRVVAGSILMGPLLGRAIFWREKTRRPGMRYCWKKVERPRDVDSVQRVGVTWRGVRASWMVRRDFGDSRKR